jgi:phospholipid/cholesterol/gamma-HCH transport system permease protein
MLTSGCEDETALLDALKQPVLAVQEFFALTTQALRNLFRPPHYNDDVFMQMDIIGVGSLPIVIPVGFLTGAVLAMQSARALQQYGAVSQTGTLVTLSLVRELGPVLTSIVVAGRNASGIASELGSMKVTEQIDAMRALGTDPTQKLVTPRLVATCFVLPLLTIIADFIGLFGGFVIAYLSLNLTPNQYWSSSWQALTYGDILQGLMKPLVFAFEIALVGCYFGLSTTGGTQGVGRSTTQAVVVSIVTLILLDLFITRVFVYS